MRRKFGAWAAAAIVAALAGMVAAAPTAASKRVQHIDFAGVPWLTPADSAAAMFAERGYPEPAAKGQREPPGTPGRPSFLGMGRILDHPVLLEGYGDERGRLVRVVLAMAPDAPKDRLYPVMRKAYDDMVAEALGRYGVRSEWVEKFSFPYDRGDGLADRALRDGKAEIGSTWKSREGDRLTIEMEKTCGVRVVYDSPDWERLLRRLRARGARDL